MATTFSEHTLEDLQRLEVFNECLAFVAPGVYLVGNHLDALEPLLELLGTQKDVADLNLEVVTDLLVPFGDVVSSKQELVAINKKADFALLCLLKQRIGSCGAS